MSNLMTAIDIGASGLTAQRRRLEVLVSNLVNANTTRPAGTEPYRRRDVMFAAEPPAPDFGSAMNEAMSGLNGVQISGVTTDASEPLKRYEPGHPHADREGYVLYPNINPMEEMVNVISATRSYEANLQAVNAAKDMAAKTLEIIR
jgi:flagellar basal-body rod protein FlgC